jgi:hypothetical protein
MNAFTRKRQQATVNVARPLLTQGIDGLLVVANQIGGNAARVVRRQRREASICTGTNWP